MGQVCCSDDANFDDGACLMEKSKQRRHQAWLCRPGGKPSIEPTVLDKCQQAIEKKLTAQWHTRCNFLQNKARRPRLTDPKVVTIDELRTLRTTSGYRGVQRLGCVYVAQLLDERVFLGRHATAEQAAHAVVTYYNLSTS